MIFAQINPAASHVETPGPFSTNVTSCDLMTAMVRPYKIGGDKFNIEVIYGTGTIEGGKLTSFSRKFSSPVELTSAELVNWGTDDSVVLSAIAKKVGTSVTGTYDFNWD